VPRSAPKSSKIDFCLTGLRSQNETRPRCYIGLDAALFERSGPDLLKNRILMSGAKDIKNALTGYHCPMYLAIAAFQYHGQLEELKLLGQHVVILKAVSPKIIVSEPEEPGDCFQYLYVSAKSGEPPQ
jgi:hypothetical protein